MKEEGVDQVTKGLRVVEVGVVPSRHLDHFDLECNWVIQGLTFL